MSGLNFSGTSKPAFAAQNVVLVERMSDFPSPSAGVITLAANTTYILYAPVAGVANILVTSDRFEFPNVSIATGTSVTITSFGSGSVAIQYTGTGAMFTSTNEFVGIMSFIMVNIQCPNGTVFDLDGTLPVGSEGIGLVAIGPTGFLNCLNMGTIRTLSVNVVGSTSFVDIGTGLILDHTREASIEGVRWEQGKNSSGAVLLSLRHTIVFPKVQNNSFSLESNETLFDISPSVTDEILVTGNTAINGLGNYATNSSGAISSAGAGAVGVSGTIASATIAASGNETVFTDVAHGLSLYQVITIAGTTSYNGTFEVGEVIDADNFRVHVAFVADESGTWSSEMTTITTSAAHGLSSQEGVSLTGTTTYDGGHNIFNASGDVFDINETFAATTTGDWTTDSLDETDNELRVIANSGISDSKTIGGLQVNGNATATVVALADMYQAWDISGSVAVSNEERFEVVDATDGIIRYIGVDVLEGSLVATIAAFKSGSTEVYRFIESVNSAVPAAGATPYANIEIKTTIDNVTFVSSVTLNPQDTIQVMVRGVGTSDNLTIQDVFMSVTPAR